QSYASPCPIALRAVAMDVNVAAQTRILRRRSLCFQGPGDGLVLRFGNQAVPQTSLGMGGVRVAQTKRKIECALVVPGEDVEVAFRRAAIAGFDFVAHGTQAQADAIGAD